jgi:hypothetical protein
LLADYILVDEQPIRLTALAEGRTESPSTLPLEGDLGSYFDIDRPAAYQTLVGGNKVGLNVLPPLDVKPGDKICILGGLQTPIVLRSKRSRYGLVGECYVDGFMDAEACQSLDVNTDLRTFEIE